MTKVARIFEEEKLQALAQAEEEKRLALAKAEEDNRQALAKAEEDNRQALAKAEEDNRQALAKERKEYVLKMLKKNYPTEEIASIISGISTDEIDAMRRDAGLFRPDEC